MIGKRLKELRKKVGWSQQKLAERSGLSYNVITKIERGAAKNPNIITIVKLASAFRISLDELAKDYKSMIKQNKNSILLFLVFITLCLFSQGIAVGVETKSDLIMNAFMDFKGKGYGDEAIKKEIKGVISGKEKTGNEWGNFLQKFKDLNNNPNVPKKELYKYEIAIIEAKKMAINLLMEITNDTYLELPKNPLENSNGSRYFNIPENIDSYKEYLNCAIDILKQPTEVFDYHPDKEDLKKIEINMLHLIDVYSDSLDKYVKYLRSLKEGDAKIKKQTKKEYEKALNKYQIESQRIMVYVSQKGRELANKYSFNDEYDAEILEKSLMQLEKKYESKN